MAQDFHGNILVNSPFFVCSLLIRLNCAHSDMFLYIPSPCLRSVSKLSMTIKTDPVSNITWQVDPYRQLRFEWVKEKCVKQILFILNFGSFCPPWAELNWKFVGAHSYKLMFCWWIWKTLKTWVGLQKKKHLGGTRNYYFKTVGHCFRTKARSPLLRRFLCNLAVDYIIMIKINESRKEWDYFEWFMFWMG